MGRLIVLLALIAACGFSGVAARNLFQVGGVPEETQQCATITETMDPKVLGAALVSCSKPNLTPAERTECCPRIEKVFGVGGELDACMCDPLYYTALLNALPESFDKEAFIDRLAGCEIAVKGTEACGGGEEGPVVQSQTILLMLLKKKLLLAALAQQNGLDLSWVNVQVG